MSHAITRCPACETAYRITGRDLSAAGGVVRCGACGRVFQAQNHFLPPATGPGGQTGSAGPPAMAPPKTRPDWPETTPAGFFQGSRPPAGVGSLKWVLGIVLLVLAGSVQYAWFNRHIWAQDPACRPWYIALCRLAACKLPDYDNIDELETRALHVRVHPGQPDALIVELLLFNRANFRQLFPGLRLQFFDVDGAPVARRTFAAGDYLGGEMRGLKYIPARAEVRLSLALVDPGKAARDYRLDVVRL